MGRVNLTRFHQTQEATAKRLHDGIDDTFVLRMRVFGGREWSGFRSLSEVRWRASYGACAIASTQTYIMCRQYHGPIDSSLPWWSSASGAFELNS